MYLEKIILFEGIPLSELGDSEEKMKLEKVKERISYFEDDIKSQPDGRIELKKSGNWFITGFSDSTNQRISKIIHLKN